MNFKKLEKGHLATILGGDGTPTKGENADGTPFCDVEVDDCIVIIECK